MFGGRKKIPRAHARTHIHKDRRKKEQEELYHGQLPAECAPGREGGRERGGEREREKVSETAGRGTQRERERETNVKTVAVRGPESTPAHISE